MKRISLAAALCVTVAILPQRIAAQNVAVGEATAAPVTKDYAGANVKELFAAVEESYKKAGIPITERDSVGFSVSNPSFEAGKKVFNINLDKIFDCGREGNAPAAANATLVLSITTKLVRVDDVVQLKSFLTASGTVMSANGPTVAHCTSLGALEKRLQPDPTKLKCGNAGLQFATVVITVERASSPASMPASSAMRGPGSPCGSVR